MLNSEELKKRPNEILWMYFELYGHHEAGVELCNRAINDDVDALQYARIIWRRAKENRTRNEMKASGPPEL